MALLLSSYGTVLWHYISHVHHFISSSTLLEQALYCAEGALVYAVSEYNKNSAVRSLIKTDKKAVIAIPCLQEQHHDFTITVVINKKDTESLIFNVAIRKQNGFLYQRDFVALIVHDPDSLSEKLVFK